MSLEEKQVLLFSSLDFLNLGKLSSQADVLFEAPVAIMDGNMNPLIAGQVALVESVRPTMRSLHPLNHLRPEQNIGVFPRDSGQWLLGMVFRQNMPVIFIAVFRLHGSWTEEDQTLCDTLLHVLDLWLSDQSPRNLLYRKTSSTRINFLIELLQGKIGSSTNLEKRLQQLGLAFPKEFCILTINMEHLKGNDITLFLASELVTDLLQCPMFCYYEDKLTFLVDTISTPPWRSDTREKLSAGLQRFALGAGYSLSCTDAIQTEHAYRDAQRSMELGVRLHPGKWLYAASDYMTYIMIDIAAEQLTITQHINPALQTLSAYDRIHHTELLTTLYVYFRHIKDPGSAARILNIHKNTFFYRMNLIRSLIKGVSLEDGEVIMQLMLSYHIMFFNGLIPELPASEKEKTAGD